MNRKKGDDPPPPKAKLNKGRAFGANDDDFQETSLLGKDKNIRTTSKVSTKDISTLGSSNAVTSEKISMTAVNKDTSAEAVLPAPIPSISCTFTPIKTSKKYKDKADKTEALKKRKEGIRRQIMSKNNKLRPMNKSKTKLSKPKNTVVKTFVINTSLANNCRYPKFVTLIQEVVDHITQPVYDGPIFANHYFLKLLKNGEGLPVITQNLFYNIFSIFAGQGKHTSDSIKSFKAFCESTSLTPSELDKYANKRYVIIISSMTKQYETLVRNYVCSTYENRAIRHILNVLSEKASYFCGNSLTVKQRKSLAKRVFQQKINLKSAWPSIVSRVERHEAIVNNFLTFWSTYNASNDADVSSEADLYAKPQCYMKWLHFIQKSLRESTLTANNSNKTLEKTSKLRNIDKKDIDAVQAFIKTVQARIQDKTFMPFKYIDPRGLRYFSLLPLYKIDSQSFWKLAKQRDNKIKPGQKNDNDLKLWYFNVFDFSKISYKTLESLTLRPKKSANVIITDRYAIYFKKTVAIQDEPRREPKAPKDFADIVDDTEFGMSQKLKFKTYINKQKGTQEIVKRLFDNSKKYGTSSTVGAKSQILVKSKHIPLPPADLPSSSQRKRIIAFENGSFGSSMKGKRAAPIRRITEEIKRK
ncbi:hypothetical protein BCV72DRAFT_327657 [Rhizopus microsporus var. microsporus]|uniref:Uncharacterized protein n=1 Tax=Rhizopus microsporus var. microsporus TaxID=86635 RepID=A0A1X0R4J3_RHIZD|nr:hypothetical protein BCV72DRAFT_327657 [Rhizopus microsporus var. microsporus]